MTRVGLVLGAGGIVGQAYHAGVLAALEHDLGWDPRSADLVVGTSAGSVTGSLLRLGVPASDLAAHAVEAPLSVDGLAVLSLVRANPALPPMSVRHLLRPWRLPSAALVARTLRRPWAFRPTAAAMTLAPDGRIDLLAHTEPVLEQLGGAWPDGLWVCAARTRDGARVVFGRDGAPPAELPRAVAASCGIPTYFTPVTIGGVTYFDGGVHSPTNADVLRDERLDLVVAVSPMSSAGGLSATVDAPWRRLAHRRLERELGRLRAAGTAVVSFEPGRRSLAVMGVNAMATDRSDRTVQAAFLEAGRRAGEPAVAAALGGIATRPSRRRPAA